MKLQWSKKFIGFNSILFLGELFTLVQEILWKTSILSLAKEEEQKTSMLVFFHKHLNSQAHKTWGSQFHFIPNNMKKNIVCNLLKKNLIIYLNVNRIPIIHYDNIFKIYLKMCYFHNTLKIHFNLKCFLKYMSDFLKTHGKCMVRWTKKSQEFINLKVYFLCS